MNLQRMILLSITELILFDISTGLETVTNGMMSYTDVFSKTLVKMAKANDRILAITAAMPDGTGLSRFQKELPDRFFDVGIAEEHAVTFCSRTCSIRIQACGVNIFIVLSESI